MSKFFEKFTSKLFNGVSLIKNEFPEVPEFEVRLSRKNGPDTYKHRYTVKNAAKILHSMLDHYPVERLIVLYIDFDSNIIGAETITIGTIDSAVFHAKDVFRGAILAGVGRVVLAHNHPTGSVEPSIKDIEMTAVVGGWSSILGIEIIDHIIVSPQGTHHSMVENKKDYLRELSDIKLSRAYRNNTIHSGNMFFDVKLI